jgi:hypothetical protein
MGRAPNVTRDMAMTMRVIPVNGVLDETCGEGPENSILEI